MNYYKAQPKQVLFHNATADEVLYGGAAGGGKSEAIMWDAVGKCLTHEGIRVAIFRRTYPELEKSIILNFLNKVPLKLRDYNKKHYRATFHATGSYLEFNHCQYEQDVFKFQSAEYDFIYFDELTHFPEFIYKYLLSRLRTTNPEIKPQIKSGTNPGNIGHLWVKRRFITDIDPYKVVEKVDTDSDIPTRYSVQFIPAKVTDNKVLMDADPAYLERLKRLPEDERRALLEGDWDVFKGQFFKEWKHDKHVVTPFDIPRDWKRFGAMDWGYAKPSCFLWFAVDPEGVVYVYRELYVTETNISDFANLVKKASVYHHDENKREKLDYIVADPSLWSVTQYEKGESIAYKLIEQGLPVMKGDNNRISGWSAMRDYFRWTETEEPMLKFFDNCKNSIRTIPALIYDEKRAEDINTDGEDHAADACRYGVMSNPLPKKIKVKPIERDTFKKHFKQKRRERGMSEYVGG